MVTGSIIETPSMEDGVSTTLKVGRPLTIGQVQGTLYPGGGDISP